MKTGKRATSIAEVMVGMLIIFTGVVGMYKVYGNSQKLSVSTNNKIQAIQIAREGIEAMKNIRDTNWILYGSDYKNCWNVLDYKPECVNNNTATYDIGHNKSYLIYQNTNSKWKLREESTGDYSNSSYRNSFRVGFDSNGFYTQSGALITSELKPIFTREIKVTYLDDGIAPNNLGTNPSNEEKMKVTSLVQWQDSSSSKPHKVEFTSVLTNWKK